MRGAYETPSEPCPYCGEQCEADWCDVGVGMIQSGPYHCTSCLAVERGPFDEDREDYDENTGWYKPGGAPGQSANVGLDGRPDVQAALDRVVAAERERCAKIAESVALPMDGKIAKAQAGYMRGIIAHHIREGGSDE